MFDKRVNEAYVVFKSRNAILGQFTFFNSHLNLILGIPVHCNALLGRDPLSNGTRSIGVNTL